MENCQYGKKCKIMKRQKAWCMCKVNHFFLQGFVAGVAGEEIGYKVKFPSLVFNFEVE